VGWEIRVSARTFTLLATRSRTEVARIVVHAEDAEEATEITKYLARSDDVIWEEESRSIDVEHANG
jgi:hypothetical protein